MRRLCTDRKKDRSEFALSQIENGCERRVLRDGLAVASCETALLKDQHEILVRDHENMLEILECVGCLRYQKRPRTDITGGDAQHKSKDECASFDATQ